MPDPEGQAGRRPRGWWPPARPVTAVHDVESARVTAAVLGGLAHPHRVRLFSALFMGGPSTAARLGDVLHEGPGTLSHHLRVMQIAGLVVLADRHWRVAEGALERLRGLVDDGGDSARNHLAPGSD